MAFPHRGLDRGCFLEEGVHELDQGGEVREQVRGMGSRGGLLEAAAAGLKRGQGAQERFRADPKDLTAIRGAWFYSPAVVI